MRGRPASFPTAVRKGRNGVDAMVKLGTEILFWKLGMLGMWEESEGNQVTDTWTGTVRSED